MTTWSAPVRYGEVDGQGIVFNANYLLYCDESMTQFCRDRGLPELPERVRVAASTLNWSSGAQWGEIISVDVRCTRLGRTSFVLGFDIRADDRQCCQVETTYVLVDDSARPTPLPDEARAALS